MIFCVYCPGTSRSELRLVHKIWPSPRPKGINKVIDLFKNTFRYILLGMLKYIPWTQEICNKVVHIEPRSLEFVPDLFKTEEMCNEAVEADPYTLRYVPVHLRTQEMCIKVVEKYLYPLKFVDLAFEDKPETL